MKRALTWLRNNLWIWLAALIVGVLMSHEAALIEDGAEVIALDVSDAIASAQQAATQKVQP